MTPDLREAVTDLLLNAGCGDSNECEAIADAILSLPALSVPEGWVAVPREPTEEMLRAGATDNTPRVATNSLDRMFESVGHIYRAMLSAIPSRPIDGAGNLDSAVASGDDGDAPASGVAE